MFKCKTPIKSIREKCIDCSGGQLKEVRLCPVTDCPLYPYRMGRRPTEVDLDTYENSYEEK